MYYNSINIEPRHLRIVSQGHSRSSIVMLIYRAYTISYFNDLILPPFAKIWHFCYALWAYVTTVSLTHAGTLSKLFSPLCSDTILVFLYQTAWQNSDGAPLMWASNAGEVGRNRDSEPYLASSHAVNRSSGNYNTISCGGPWRVYNTSRW